MARPGREVILVRHPGLTRHKAERAKVAAELQQNISRISLAEVPLTEVS